MTDTPEEIVETWTDEEVNTLFDQMQWSVDAINELIDGTREMASDQDRDDAIQRNLDHLTQGQEKAWYTDDSRDKSAITSAVTAAQTHLG
jgi:hypothetical protein